ncbi:MAG: hypothetical protein WCI50_01800 [Actinomycetes bacterium]
MSTPPPFPRLRARNHQGLVDRSTITVGLVDRTGHIGWQGTGGFTDDRARDLEAALAADRRA